MVTTARFMFLGGTLDHSTRAVEIEINGMPIEDRIVVERVSRASSIVDHILPADPEQEVYIRHRCASGSSVWWTYVLSGFAPSPMNLLDANPYP